MKILSLNPKLDAEHKVSRFLKENGMDLLFASDSQEAWQILQFHKDSIDLAIVHKEGVEGSFSGIQFISKLKKDSSLRNLPVILTSDTWTEADCIAHQSGPEGVNGYLRAPYSELQLFDTIQTLFGGVGEQKIEGSDISLVLEDATMVYKGAEETNQRQISVQLEPPSIKLPTPDLTKTRKRVTPSPVSPAFPSAESPPLLSIQTSQTSQPSQSPQELSQRIEPASPEKEAELDPEAMTEMPYLYGKPASQGGLVPPASPSTAPNDADLSFLQPLGDVVVPGGATESPDLETLKKYLLLREQDVAVLSNQLKLAREQIKGFEKTIQAEKTKSAELAVASEEKQKTIEALKLEREEAMAQSASEMAEVQFQLKSKSDKIRLLENEIKDSSREMEHLKERVRADIRKIRVREKDLENRLEILRKDSEALIGARENKIIELKRKLDLLEFNMDLLQDQISREKETSETLRGRLAKAAQMVRAAGGLLDSSKKGDSGPVDASLNAEDSDPA